MYQQQFFCENLLDSYEVFLNFLKLYILCCSCVSNYPEYQDGLKIKRKKKAALLIL